jgi:hypothetical protein
MTKRRVDGKSRASGSHCAARSSMTTPPDTFVAIFRRSSPSRAPPRTMVSCNVAAFFAEQFDSFRSAGQSLRRRQPAHCNQPQGSRPAGGAFGRCETLQVHTVRINVDLREGRNRKRPAAEPLAARHQGRRPLPDRFLTPTDRAPVLLLQKALPRAHRSLDARSRRADCLPCGDNNHPWGSPEESMDQFIRLFSRKTARSWRLVWR